MSPSSSLLLLAFLLPAADPKEDAKKDLEKMQGTWKVEKVVVDGKEKSAEERAKISVSIEKNVYTIQDGDHTFVAEFTIDPSTKPAEFNVLPKIQATTKDPNAGKTRRGIYELSGDTLTICWAREGGERPKTFESKSETKTVLFELKKQKK